MYNRPDIIYIYDGSYEGMLCCIFESFEKREMPSDIQAAASPQVTLYRPIEINTDFSKAERVKIGIIKKASAEAYELVSKGYYTCHPNKERLILDYVRLCMQYGRKVLRLLSNDTVCELQGAVRKLGNECHKLKGFIRFSIHSGILVSIIEPNNFVLPDIAPHFCDRYSEEAFVIYDQSHGAALIYRPHEASIIEVDKYDAPICDKEEEFYRSLWKTFYNTIAIDERYNPRCRMGLMPKRYWTHLTEMDPHVIARRASIEEKRKEALYIPVSAHAPKPEHKSHPSVCQANTPETPARPSYLPERKSPVHQPDTYD